MANDDHVHQGATIGCHSPENPLPPFFSFFPPQAKNSPCVTTNKPSLMKRSSARKGVTLLLPTCGDEMAAWVAIVDVTKEGKAISTLEEGGESAARSWKCLKQWNLPSDVSFIDVWTVGRHLLLSNCQRKIQIGERQSESVALSQLHQRGASPQASEGQHHKHIHPTRAHEHI